MNARSFGIAACIALASPACIAQHAEHPQPPQAQVDHSKMDHSQMDHSTMDHGDDARTPPREPIPAVTDADRTAAFPPVHAHHQHGTSIHHYTLIDRLEVADGGHGGELGWETGGWIGGDVQKLWWRSEGHAADGKVARGSVEALYGRGIRAWWDVVAGVRHDFGAGPSRNWLGVGVQGLAPYKFEVSATAYVGEQGRTALVAEAEYDTLLTNRLILQWRAEASAYGKDDPALGIGRGLSSVEAGLRLRYEITRQFAPYIGIEHERAFGGTARLRRATGDAAGDTRAVAGLRIWF
ncbi:copper resistance protein B [Thermomonas brevis]